MELSRANQRTWLCPDAASRERLLDMEARLRGPRSLAFGLIGLTLLWSSSALGIKPVLLLAATVLAFTLTTKLQPRMAAPEYAAFAAYAVAELSILVAVAITGGSESHAMSWVIIPVITLPARFGLRPVVAGVVSTAAGLLMVLLLAPTADAGGTALAVVFPLAALAAIAILSTALMRSDLEHRTEAIIDGLTGMLNRRALGQRLAELALQAEVTRQPIAVIAGDLDHFKRVNDEHGHATGDAVLVDLAYRIRKNLRAFDLAYRVGGEEFLVLLPGAQPAEACAIAEHLREAIAREPVAGVAITMSFGVAGSDASGFDSQAVVAAADRALYAAKTAGRDRVVADGAVPAAA
jgi:diguanylate cyclase (GGDEF)-like protein